MSKTGISMRSAYYLGIGLLVLNALPMAREYLGSIFDYQISPGLTVVTVVAVLVAVGAFFAYNRRYI